MFEINKALAHAKANVTVRLINSKVHGERQLVRLYQASLTLGHVPRLWREASKVVLHKPGKKDYGNPKAYRPISR